MELNSLRLRALWDDLRTSLWALPVGTTTMAFILAVSVAQFDRNGALGFGFTISSSQALSILATIAGSMLTVVTMTFSILMVVMVLASQQFSPRILRNFMRGQTSQYVLSIFIGAFVYSLTVMLFIGENNVPVGAVGVAVLLALGSMVALIYYIDFIAKHTRVSYILAEINRQTEGVLGKLRTNEQRHLPAEADNELLPTPPNDALHIFAEEVGYVQAIDFDEVVRLAAADKVIIRMERIVGDFVSAHGDFLTIWPVDHVSEDLGDKLRATFDIGTERTMLEDVLLGLRQLEDIALKAVSPAVNDPTTASNCVNYMTNLLILAAESPDLPTRYYDENSELRLFCQRSSFEAMIDLAFGQLRHYTSGDVAIIEHLLEALCEIAQRTQRPARLEVLWRHARLIAHSAANHNVDPLERHKLNGKLKRLARQVGQPADSILLNVNAN
ncbi:MAG: DUF2254 domain-containing protein [Caldilineaceae bacterium]